MKPVLYFLLQIVFVAAASAQTKSPALQKVLAAYSKSTSLQAEILKIDEKIILGTKTESKGRLKYQSKKLFIALEGERKNEFYYNGKTLTLIEYPDADFSPEGPRKITHLKKSIPPFVNSLLNLFSQPKIFNKEFKTLKESQQDNLTLVDLQAQQKNFKSFQIKIDNKSNRIVEIIFIDDVDTKTTVQLLQTQLNKKIKKSDLVFVKTKTDEEITE